MLSLLRERGQVKSNCLRIISNLAFGQHAKMSIKGEKVISVGSLRVVLEGVNRKLKDF